MQLTNPTPNQLAAYLYGIRMSIGYSRKQVLMKAEDIGRPLSLSTLKRIEDADHMSAYYHIQTLCLIYDIHLTYERG